MRTNKIKNKRNKQPNCSSKINK